MEDNASDTIRPRLEAAGADLSRIHLFPNGGQRQFVDHRSLISLIRQVTASLVIVDPLSAYLRSRYVSSDQQIRDLFARMAAIAQHTGATFLIVHHPNKARSGAAVMRSAGSLAVTAAARSVMLIAGDSEDPSSRILAVVKGNLGPLPPARRFHFVQEQGAPQPNIHWDGVAETVTADTLLHKSTR
jgi:RecA-family ATPase